MSCAMISGGNGSLELQDVQTAGGLSQVDQPTSIDEHVGGGDRPWWRQSSRWRRDKCRNLFWTERVGNAEHTKPRVLIRHEDDFRALEAAPAIFMHIVRPELATHRAV